MIIGIDYGKAEVKKTRIEIDYGKTEVRKL